MIPNMPVDPASADKPCWHCEHYGGWTRFASGRRSGNIWCATYEYVRTQPENGCSKWELQEPPRTAPMFAPDFPIKRRQGPASGPPMGEIKPGADPAQRLNR